MKVEFKESFDKDLQVSPDINVAKQIKKLVMRLESAKSLNEIPNVKKLAGGSDFYRIRIGDYRIGLVFKKDKVTLVRLLHRKEIYRYFP